jgi:hypothetical protein
MQGFLARDIEFGPEQLVARIPVERTGNSKEDFIPHVK